MKLLLIVMSGNSTSQVKKAMENKTQNTTIELLTIEDVAKLLRVSPSTVRRLQQGRRLPFIKIGGSVRFAKDDIIDFLKKVRIESIG